MGSKKPNVGKPLPAFQKMPIIYDHVISRNNIPNGAHDWLIEIFRRAMKKHFFCASCMFEDKVNTWLYNH